MGESRVKSGRKKGFFVLLRDAAQDARLSLEARGLFAMMSSLPDNWDYSVSGLAIKAGCGKDKIRRLLKELERVGYLVREQSHDKGGKFAGNTYILQDEAPPLSGNPDNGTGEENQPLSGNTDDGENRQRQSTLTEIPTQKNIDYKEQETIKNPLYPPAGDRPSRRRKKSKAVPAWEPERFEGFWQAYPRDEDRALAVEQWELLPRDQELMDKHGGDASALLREISLGLKRHLECEDWRSGTGIPYAFRWLRDRRWTEKKKAPGSVAQSQPSQADMTPKRFGWD